MTTDILTSSPARSRHDGLTIALHWLTALLVIALFASAETWGFLPKGSFLRNGLQSLHISMGITLAAVMVARILWRLARRYELPSDLPRWQEMASSLVHLALYLLLAAQLTLGFLFRWAQGEPFSFFGLFEIPHVAIDPDLARTFGELHNIVAWTIICLAGLHAVAALGHHYVLKDKVLLRMMPGK
ncbi:cytochrome b561 [Labrys miyagiensis]|uniref:Cytochrome b561 n=1 Tax=Labrys miyagiensis TaxID=346912 RepID=A0ABQ6CTA4_9HYPH|nr:cytochrome b [Labrys miyagiensis]GLS21959.1 cytochrome b561 [Labrys miyagiensis]